MCPRNHQPVLGTDNTLQLLLSAILLILSRCAFLCTAYRHESLPTRPTLPALVAATTTKANRPTMRCFNSSLDFIYTFLRMSTMQCKDPGSEPRGIHCQVPGVVHPTELLCTAVTTMHKFQNWQNSLHQPLKTVANYQHLLLHRQGFSRSRVGFFAVGEQPLPLQQQMENGDNLLSGMAMV